MGEMFALRTGKGTARFLKSYSVLFLYYAYDLEDYLSASARRFTV